jgi:hypothetical protein
VLRQNKKGIDKEKDFVSNKKAGVKHSGKT